LTTKIDTHALFETFGKDANVETFLSKAIHKAYREVDPNAKCEINGTGEHAIGLSSVAESLEALPVCVAPTIIQVHATPVIQEVVLKDADLKDIDDDDLTAFPASATHHDLIVR